VVLGAKVRALAEGRYNVSIEDIKAMAVPALRHRVILNFEGEAEGVDTDTLIARVVSETEAGVAQSREPFLR
jgi:MoxR-like ATPase